jgi:methylmalonyl-CoA mutase, N-terminal domain
MMLRFHAQTAGSSLTAQQVDNNIVRVAIQALAAVLGGTQSLHTNSRDEALGLPTEDAVRTALRTQQIIAFESGVADTVDPLAGSYYIEQLTDAIEAEALALIRRIDEQGGVVACIENGFIQSQIEDASYRYQQEIEQGERIIVGVNAFQATDEKGVPVMRVDPGSEEQQVRRLAEVKAGRDPEGRPCCPARTGQGRPRRRPPDGTCPGGRALLLLAGRNLWRAAENFWRIPIGADTIHHGEKN